MKLRLPTKLLSAVLAACSVSSSFAFTLVGSGETTTIAAETGGMYPITVYDGGILILNNVNLRLNGNDNNSINLTSGGSKLATTGSTTIGVNLNTNGMNTIQNGNTDASDLVIDHLMAGAVDFDNPDASVLTFQNVTGSRTVVNRFDGYFSSVNIAAPTRIGNWSETQLGTTGNRQQCAVGLIVTSIGGATGSNASSARMSRLILGGVGDIMVNNDGTFTDNFAVRFISMVGDGSELILARDPAFPDNDAPMGITTVTGYMKGGGVIAAQGHQRLSLSQLDAPTTYDGVLSDNKRTIVNSRIGFENNADNVLSFSVYASDVTLSQAPNYTGFTMVTNRSKLTFKANDVTLRDIQVSSGTNDASSLVFNGKANFAGRVNVLTGGSVTVAGDLVLKGDARESAANNDFVGNLIRVPLGATADASAIKVGGSLVGTAGKTYYIDGRPAVNGAGYVLRAEKGFSGLTEASFVVLADEVALQTNDFWINLTDKAIVLNKLSIGATEDVWKNMPGATWVDGGAGWTIGGTVTDGNFANGASVRFHEDVADLVQTTHTVTVDAAGVTAGDITVIGKNSNYTLAGGAVTASKLTKYGASVLTLSNANTINGDIKINGGTLVLNNLGALGGTGNLSFDATSGLLKYGDGIAPTFDAAVNDLSTRISGVMRLDLNGNQIKWTAKAKNDANWLTDVTLSNSKANSTGSLKTSTLPTGTLTLGAGTEWVLDMKNEATVFTAPTTLKGSGAIRLSGGSAGITIANTGVSIQNQDDFTGKWIYDNYFERNTNLSNIGKKATIVFDNCGSAMDRYFASGNLTIAQNIELSGTGLTLQNGFSKSIYEFAGSLSGAGTFTRKGAIGDTYIFSGDVSRFEGNISFEPTFASGNNNRLVFGGNSVEIVATGNLNHVTGTGTFTVNTNLVYNYANDVTSANAYAGSGTLIKKASNTMSLTKDVTIAKIEIENGTLVLKSGVTQLTSGTIANNGTLKFDFGATDMAVAGIISGTGGVTHNGTGNITLSGVNTYAGTTLISGGGKLTATSANSFGTGAITLAKGSVDLASMAMGNEMLLQNGNVLNAGNFTGSKNVTVQMTPGAGNMNLGGMNGSALKSIDTSSANPATDAPSGPVLSGIAGGMALDKLALTVRAGNMYIASNPQVLDLAPGRAQAVDLVLLNESNGSITVDASQLSVNMNNDTTIALLKELRKQNDNGVVGIAITNGKLVITGNINNVSASPLLGYLGFAAIGKDDAALGWKDDGCLYITGYTDKVYMVTNDVANTNSHTISAYGSMDPYKAIVVEAGQTLKINLSGAPEADRGDLGLELKNLTAGTGSHILATNTSAAGHALVDINSEISDGNGLVVSADVTGVGRVDFRKTGEGTTTIEGDLDTDGNLIADEGTLILKSQTVNTNGILLEGGNLEMINSVTTGALGGTGGSLKMNDGKILTIKGTDGSESVLSGVDISGKTIWQLKGNANIKMGEGSRLSGQELEVRENATFNMGAESHSVSSFNGDGTLKGEGGRMTVASEGNNVFSGQLTGNGTFVKDGSGSLDLRSAGSSGMVLSLNKGTLSLAGSPTGQVAYAGLSTATGTTLKMASGTDGVSNMSMNLGSGNLSIANGTNVELSVIPLVKAGMSGPVISSQGSVSVGSGSSFVLSCGEEYKNPENFQDLSMVLFKGSQASLGDNISVSGKGLFLVYYTDLALVNNGAGSIVLTGRQQDDNIFMRVAQSDNARAGAALAWDARQSVTESTVLGSALADMATAVYSENTASVSKSLAGMAGSSLPSLLTAQKDMLRTQMSQLRNRTVFMGTAQDFETKDMPYYNMWVQATGSYTQLDGDGDNSGYKMNSWGGMLGMDCDISKNMTIGAALTVSYGDFTSNDVDHLSADTEYYYLSMFGRYQRKSWGHTMIFTGGWNNADTERTVSYDGGSYTAKAKPTGFGFGAMYELTYDIPGDENGNTVWQPLFNASVTRANLDDFSETNAGDAGLDVRDMNDTLATLALGGRVVTVAGENMFGRGSLFHLRMNVAQDFGDTRSDAKVSFLGNAGFSQKVRASEAGKTAIQAGAGMAVPVGVDASIYIDFNLDARSRQIACDASIGYRVNL